MSSPSLLHASSRPRRSVAQMAFATAGVLLLLAACSHYRGSVPSPDIGMAKLSAHQLYRAAVRPSAVPIPVRSLQVWTLHVETAEGSPVNAATITMNGGMPQHGHGLPTKPRVTRELGNGDHLVEGVKFNMGGWWVVRFAITSSAGTDTVTFNLGL
jgi:hypothetical protein